MKGFLKTQHPCRLGLHLLGSDFMPITIKDVAKMADVSPSTVSRVIADNPKISDVTKQKVYAAMEALNYHPNAIARSLANKSTRTLGLILPNTDEDLFVNPFFIQVMRGISLYAQKKGYYIMYTYSDHEEEEVSFIKNLMNSKWVDGFILTTARKDDKCISYLKEVDHPFVVIGRPENVENTLWVDNDNFHAMYTVVNRLIQRGKREIAFIGGPLDMNVTRNRLEGYKRALENCGIEVDPKLIKETNFSEVSGYEAMREILKTNMPTAVVTTDDLIAFGANKAIKELTSHSVQVVGFNNTPMAAYQTPSLTSVDINAEELGYFASKLLINKLENKKEKIKSYIVETRLVERDSTAFED